MTTLVLDKKLDNMYVNGFGLALFTGVVTLVLGVMSGLFAWAGDAENLAHTITPLFWFAGFSATGVTMMVVAVLMQKVKNKRL